VTVSDPSLKKHGIGSCQIISVVNCPVTVMDLKPTKHIKSKGQLSTVLRMFRDGSVKQDAQPDTAFSNERKPNLAGYVEISPYRTKCRVVLDQGVNSYDSWSNRARRGANHLPGQEKQSLPKRLADAFESGLSK